ncbi:MAG: hypothetical protein ACR2NF_00210 [Pirellulales bacterium]
MVTGAAIARAEGRFQSLRSRDAVSILYSSWASGLPPMRRDNLPRDFHKYSESRSIEFKPDSDRHSLFLTHCACPESENLLIDAFRDISIDLKDALEKHQFTTGFRTRELDWAVALIEASHKGLLGSAGYDEVWWQDSTDPLLIAGRIKESFAEKVDLIDHYMVELTNAVESSLRLVEILETEPEAPKQTKPRGDDTEQRLRMLWTEDQFYCLTHSIAEIAKRIDRSKGQVSKSQFWQEVITLEKDVNGMSHKKLERLRKARDSGYALKDIEERQLSYLESLKGN